MQLKSKFGKLIKSLIEINKLGEDARGRHHEFMIVIEVNVQKVPSSLMKINKYCELELRRKTVTLIYR